MKSLPFFVRMKNFLLIVFVVLIVPLPGCRTNRKASSLTVTERHTDSVAALRSIRASLIERETVTETIVIRPDTITGELRVVARDITKTTERATETAKTGDTARFVSKGGTDIRDEKTSETQGNAATAGDIWQLAIVWLSFAFLAALLALYLRATWKSRN